MAVGCGRRKGGGRISDVNRTKKLGANEQCRFALQSLTDSIGPLLEAAKGSEAVLKSQHHHHRVKALQLLPCNLCTALLVPAAAKLCHVR